MLLRLTLALAVMAALLWGDKTKTVTSTAVTPPVASATPPTTKTAAEPFNVRCMGRDPAFLFFCADLRDGLRSAWKTNLQLFSNNGEVWGVNAYPPPNAGLVVAFRVIGRLPRKDGTSDIVDAGITIPRGINAEDPQKLNDQVVELIRQVMCRAHNKK